MTEPRLKKLDDHSKSMVYLDVEEGSKAHRLYNPHSDKLHVSKDVVFQEDMDWEWSKSNEVNTCNYLEFIVSTIVGETEISGLITNIEAGGMMDTIGTTVAPVLGVSGITGSAGGKLPLQEGVLSSAPNTTLAERTMSYGPETANTPDTDGRSDGYQSLADIYAETEGEQIFKDLLLLEIEEPTSYCDATGEVVRDHAVKREVETIEDNDTWILIELPPRYKSIGLKWIYKVK